MLTGRSAAAKNFTTLHSFNGSDGANPSSGLLLSGTTLYGTANNGGYGWGTVFKVQTDGTGFTNLHNFISVSDGAYPGGSLILSDNVLYGTAAGGGGGGGFGDGTVSSLSFPPQLAIIPAASKVILTWPTNFAGFDYSGFTLQSTANLASPASWTPVSPAPVVVNGHYTVTNPITGTQQFYRLSQ